MRHASLRRRGVLALSGCAAAIAGGIAMAPMIQGADPAPETATFLNRVEGGGSGHDQAHLGASPAAKRAAAARLGSCDDAAWVAANPGACPADPVSPTETRTALAAGEQVGALGPTQPDGLWGPLLSIPSTAIHAVVLPTNKVLLVSPPRGVTGEIEETDGGNAYVWDPATNTSVAVPPPKVAYPSGANRPANLWCGGQVTLADGRVLFAGGNLTYPANGGTGAGNGFRGAGWVMTFDPWTEEWTAYADMPHGRWYPTLTELPDGKVLIISGWDESGGVDGPGGPGDSPTMLINQDVEVFDPATPAGGVATTVVSKLPGPAPSFPDHTGIGLYPHMFVLPQSSVAGAGGHKVLVAGPGKYDSAILDTQTWGWIDILDRSVQDLGQPRISKDRSWGTAWLAPSGPAGSDEVVLLGGSDVGGAAPGAGTAPPPLASAEALDLDDPDGGWVLRPELALGTGRAHFNTLLLPDGSIFANGGGYGRKADTLYAEPIYTAELYTPGSGWRAVGDEADARTYHSVSVLLPDGRVASAGDDRDIAPLHVPLDKRTAQLWSPPYLFDGPRPAVTFAPEEVGYDADFRVAVDGDPSAITGAMLVRPAAVTHSADMSQRAISLAVSPQADGITLRSPLDATVAPPGYYMLFVRNAAGVPSVASWVRIAPGASGGPALPDPPAFSSDPDSPVPAPAPPGSRRVKRLTATVQRPAVTQVSGRVRVVLRLRANRRATARIRVTRSTTGRGPTRTRTLGTRTLPLAAGATSRSTILVPRASFRRGGIVRIGVVIRGRSGGEVVINRIAELPARR